MESILEMRYKLPGEKIHARGSPFVRTARIKFVFHFGARLMAELIKGKEDVL